MNLYFDLYSRIAHRPLFNQHINVAVLGEFNRVTHQIGDHLLQAQRIANHIIRDIAFNVEGELKAFIVRRMCQQGHHFIQGITQQERNAFQNQLARFELGEIQHVIDDGQKIIRRTFDGGQVVTLGSVEIGFQGQTGKANHAVKRGS